MSLSARGFLFSNKSYADNISIKTVICSSGNIQKSITAIESNKETQSTTYDAVRGNNAYLIIALKNRGQRRAWGVLDLRSYLFSYDLFVNRLPSNQWSIHVVPLGKHMTQKIYDGLLQLEYEWDYLQTK